MLLLLIVTRFCLIRTEGVFFVVRKKKEKNSTYRNHENDADSVTLVYRLRIIAQVMINMPQGQPTRSKRADEGKRDS